jgi:AraC-like DNA-binding protein
MIDQSTLTRIFESTAIPLFLVGRDGTVELAAPALISANIHPSDHLPELGYLHQCLIRHLRPENGSSLPSVNTAPEGYYVGVADIAPSVYLVFGPAACANHTRQGLMQNQLGPLFGGTEQSEAALLSLLPMVSYRRFINAFLLSIQALNGRSFEHSDVLNSNTSQPMAPDAVNITLAQRFLDADAGNHIHTPFWYEQAVLDEVKAGNVNGLKRRMEEPVPGAIGRLSRDFLRQEQFAFIYRLALTSRAAIEGGLPPEFASSLADAYSRQMDALTDPQDIFSLSHQMVEDFTEKVAAQRHEQGYSPKIAACCQYIHEHLHENVELSHLSQLSGLCTRAISERFRAETGSSVSEYLHHERMQEAKYLLRYTQLSILEVSNHLNYSTQSYFTQTFKNAFGVTPRQYRDGLRGNDL